MNEFEVAPDGVRVDLRSWAWVVTLYLDDLEAVLGPEVEIPEDPLDALAATIGSSGEAPSDPVRARLLPDGVLDDAGAAADFRRFSEAALLQRKRADARALRAVLDHPSVVSGTAARQLLGALNDLRLMLGTRLAVTEEGVLSGGEDLHAYRSYQLFTGLQSLLVDVLARPDEPEGREAP